MDTKTKDASGLEETIEAGNIISFGTTYYPLKQGLNVGAIKDGVVIDHITAGKAHEICDVLGLSEYPVQMGWNQYSSSMGKKDFIKITDGTLTKKIYKAVAVISPEATFNVIKESGVVEKTQAIICEKPDCETRDLDKEVPSLFYTDDNDKLRCQTCDAFYERESMAARIYTAQLNGDKHLNSAVNSISSKIASLKKEHDEESIKQLAVEVNLYVLESVFFAGYNKEGECFKDELKASVRRRLEKCGFTTEDFAAVRLIKSAEEFAERYFLSTYDDWRWQINKDAVKNKDQLLDRFRKEFDPSRQYITSNMEKAIEQAVVD